RSFVWIETNQSGMAPQGRNHLDEFEIDLFRLVKRGASPEQWAEWLRFPLEHAAAKGDASLVARLIGAGANGGVGWRGCGGRTLLGAAAQGSSEGVVLALLNAGAGPEVNLMFSNGHIQEAALHVAAKLGADLVSKALMGAGADPNLADSTGRRPLYLAAKAGFPRVVKLLLVNGALPNLTDDDWTLIPLYACCSYWEPSDRSQEFGVRRALCASELIDAGVSLNAECRWGWRLLITAVENDLVEVVEVLLAAGASVDLNYPSPREAAQAFWEDRSLMCSAVKWASASVVRALLRHGCDANERDDGGTALHHAARRSDNGDTVRALLAGGADAEARGTKDHHGNIEDMTPYEYYPEYSVTPLHVAVIRGKKTTGPLLALLEGKANIHAQTADGRTVLHIACRISDMDAVGLLLRWGADESILDKKGYSAKSSIGLDGLEGFWSIEEDESEEEFEQRMQEERLPEQQSIYQMIARNASWRRRGWLVLFRAYRSKVEFVEGGDCAFRSSTAAARARRGNLD
ncbi:unnamed protein product, partial [Scytosiphon promiscuus]